MDYEPGDSLHNYMVPPERDTVALFVRYKQWLDFIMIQFEKIFDILIYRRFDLMRVNGLTFFGLYKPEQPWNQLESPTPPKVLPMILSEGRVLTQLELEEAYREGVETRNKSRVDTATMVEWIGELGSLIYNKAATKEALRRHPDDDKTTLSPSDHFFSASYIYYFGYQRKWKNYDDAQFRNMLIRIQTDPTYRYKEDFLDVPQLDRTPITSDGVVNLNALFDDLLVPKNTTLIKDFRQIVQKLKDICVERLPHFYQYTEAGVKAWEDRMRNTNPDSPGGREYRRRHRMAHNYSDMSLDTATPETIWGLLYSVLATIDKIHDMITLERTDVIMSSEDFIDELKDDNDWLQKLYRLHLSESIGRTTTNNDDD